MCMRRLSGHAHCYKHAWPSGRTWGQSLASEYININTINTINININIKYAWLSGRTWGQSLASEVCAVQLCPFPGVMSKGVWPSPLRAVRLAPRESR